MSWPNLRDHQLPRNVPVAESSARHPVNQIDKGHCSFQALYDGRKPRLLEQHAARGMATLISIKSQVLLLSATPGAEVR